MRIRSGIPEIDRLEDECAAQAPPLVASIDDVLVDAESVQISAKTLGLARLAERPNLRRLIASGVGVYVTFTGPWTSLIGYTAWVSWIGGISVLSLMAGAILFFIGQATIRSNVSDEEAIAEATGQAAS